MENPLGKIKSCLCKEAPEFTFSALGYNVSFSALPPLENKSNAILGRHEEYCVSSRPIGSLYSKAPFKLETKCRKQTPKFPTARKSFQVRRPDSSVFHTRRLTEQKKYINSSEIYRRVRQRSYRDRDIKFFKIRAKLLIGDHDKMPQVIRRDVPRTLPFYRDLFSVPGNS